MFKILVADDEPTGLNHVCTILEKKCPQYEIMAVAENGKQALEMIRKERPDILITDIKMPVMDGIELISRVKKEFPEVLSVIVSGYSEFEYAKEAIQSGVCDYLLKPLVPSDMQKLMEQLEIRLKTFYYTQRNKILRALCNGKHLEEKQKVSRYFPAGQYYAAVFRQNGLPRRFSKKNGVEIFSMEEEKIYIYGRDEMESLYLIPQKLLFQETFLQITERIFEKEQRLKKGAYVTGIAYGKEFTLENLPEVAERLYRKLDESIVIGKNRLIWDTEKKQESKEDEQEKKEIEYIEYLIRYKESAKLLNEIKKLFYLWDKCECSQLHVESNIKYLFRMFQNVYSTEQSFSEIEFWIDDVFYYASDMTELEENVTDLLKQCIPDSGKENMDNKEALFSSILSYLNAHIRESLSLGDICREFGVSQTSLSRMFRTYQETSFSNYLTEIRINKAKEIMEKAPESYVKDIAERCGYSDQFYFSRIFRSVTGMCPKEYMEQQL